MRNVLLQCPAVFNAITVLSALVVTWGLSWTRMASAVRAAACQTAVSAVTQTMLSALSVTPATTWPTTKLAVPALQLRTALSAAAAARAPSVKMVTTSSVVSASPAQACLTVPTVRA